MYGSDWVLKVILLTIALLLGTVVLRPLFAPQARVSADAGQFDFVTIISPVFIYQGNQGVLLLDRRNGNVWFIGKGNQTEISFKDPVFVVRLPLERLNQAPR